MKCFACHLAMLRINAIYSMLKIMSAVFNASFLLTPTYSVRGNSAILIQNSFKLVFCCCLIKMLTESHLKARQSWSLYRRRCFRKCLFFTFGLKTTGLPRLTRRLAAFTEKNINCDM